MRKETPHFTEHIARSKYRTQRKYPHMHRVLICGSRNWTDPLPIIRVLEALQREHPKLLIITGGAEGADTLAFHAALRLGIHAARVPAIWHYYGKRAGPMRNTAMLTLRPMEIIAFHDAISESKGTRDMIVKGMRHGLRVRIWRKSE